MRRLLIVLITVIVFTTNVYGVAPTDSALDYINTVRTKIRLLDQQKLPKYTANTQLYNAAKNHSEYLEKYNVLTHQQDRNKDLFSGIYPWDRAAHYGYESLYVDEIVYESTNSSKEDMYELIDNPYYRIELLNPNYTDIGIAKTDENLVVQVGGTKSKQAYHVQFPFTNQKNVPRIWNPNETELSPLRLYNSKGPYGYPITYTVYSPIKIKNIETVKYSESLTNKYNNTKKEIYINTPNIDNYLSNSIVIIPKSPLDSNTEYEVKFTVSITYANNEQVKQDVKWSFKTGSYATTNNIAEQERINRQQFAELLVDEYDIPITNKGNYSYVDVVNNSTYAKYIYTLRDIGIMKGYSPYVFGYDDYLTREQAIVIIMRLYSYLSREDYTEIPIENYHNFGDIDKCSPWSIDAVKAAYNLEIIHGKTDNILDPGDYINYGQSKEMVNNLSKLLETLH